MIEIACMKDKIFIDTNIFVYAFLDHIKDNDSHIKHIKAKEFLHSFQGNAKVIISTQVCNEYYSALLKNKIEDNDIQKSLNLIMNAAEVAPINDTTVFGSFGLKNRYKYSYWDSLILASALENDCVILYSEDMQHKQTIENKLQIVNPFLP